MALSNGVNGTAGSTSAQIDVSTIIKALEVIHSPSSNNDDRREASGYLENVKSQEGIGEPGYALASDTSQQPLVRHFGLSMLEHVVKHQAFALNEQNAAHLRQLVLSLSQTLDSTPQAFIRNKIAALWVELAKRSWGLDWFDLDDFLNRLWIESDVSREFVLVVLENLSEDVFNREDATAVLRGGDLNEALVEIFTSKKNFAGGLKIGNTTYQIRQGDEGWTTKITNLLGQLLQSQELSKESRKTIVLSLSVLRSAFTWLMTPAVVNANTMPTVCGALTQNDPETILAGIDTLIALYARQKLEEVEVQALVHPLCQAGSVQVLRDVFQWSVVGPDETLDPRYAISKKLSELIYHITSSVTQNDIPQDTDFTAYLQLLTQIAQHDSLIVSIAALHSWDKLLQSSKWRRSSSIQLCIEPLLQVAMRRIIAYDLLPENAEDPAVLFVNDEIELHPERQGFFLNYRRFCYSVIEWIAYSFTEDALVYILEQVDSGLDQIEVVDQALDSEHYTRMSRKIIDMEALFQVIDAAFRGIDKWSNSRQESNDANINRRKESLQDAVRTWSTNMLSKRAFKDPAITHRQIKSAVETSSRNLKNDTKFAFRVLEYILSSFGHASSGSPALVDATNDLHTYATSELRKLCVEHASYFVTFYEQLEAKLADILEKSAVEPKVRIDLKAVLMLLIEHAEGIDRNLRLNKMREFIHPLSEPWSMAQSIISDYDTFVLQMGFDRVATYLENVGAKNQADWTTVGFGDDAANIQTYMLEQSGRIPLRETRVLLSVSTERLLQGSETYHLVQEVWQPMLQTVIASVMRLTKYCHELHDPARWPSLASSDHALIRRLLRDRYWQSGISGGSMNDFHASVKATKTTLEGFASSVRGRIRVTLENCYSILHTMGRLGTLFYGFPEVPNSIAEAVFDSASPLSPHHFGQLLSMTPKLVEECPPEDRSHFLTPVLAALLRQIDSKCADEWQKLHERGGTDASAGESLSNEMREESVLRQMTSKAVNMLSLWISPQREVALANNRRIVNHSAVDGSVQSLRDFILSSRPVIEPLLLFCTHALTYKDTKTCATICSTIQHLVPAFGTEQHLSGNDAAAVREYISTEMLKAAINSLNDGYFADYHGHLAILIGTIWTTCGLPAHVPATALQPAHDRPAWTQTPRNVLLSIPGLSENKIDIAGTKLVSVSASARKTRSVILQLLEGVKGIRISEMGKYDTRAQKSSLLEKYKMREVAGMQHGQENESTLKVEGGAIDLGGVADMFA